MKAEPERQAGTSHQQEQAEGEADAAASEGNTPCAAEQGSVGCCFFKALDHDPGTGHTVPQAAHGLINSEITVPKAKLQMFRHINGLQQKK